MGRVLLRSACVACAAAFALGLGASRAAAQEIRGLVVLEGWGEPVGGVVVTLLSEALVPVDSVTADAGGAFVFDGLESGTYYLQAARAGSYSELSTAVDVLVGAETDDVLLTFTSPLFRRALACLADEGAAGSGVLAGVAYEAETDIPLPGARISLQWERPGSSERGRREAVADAAGRFVFCGVPADVPLMAWTHALGRVSPAQEGIVVGHGVLARHDLPLRLDVSPSFQVVHGAQRGDDADPATLTGRLVDAATGQPVADAAVRLGGVPVEHFTDARGRFRFDDVPPGTYAVEVRHLGYGRQSEQLELPGGAEVTVELALAARAVELEGITVMARPERSRFTIAGARASQTLDGARLESIRTRGAILADALYEIPGLRVVYARDFGEGPLKMCVEATRGRAAIMAEYCNMVEVFVDGVQVERETAEALLSAGITDYDSIEYVPPVTAMRWGFRANEAGALLLWTRGRRPEARRR